MKRTTRSLVATIAAVAVLAVSVIGTAAQRTGMWSSRSGPLHAASGSLAAPAAACKALEPGEVTWVTLDEDGNVAETVESYPSEATKVTAAFEYACIPKKTTLITVWSIDGETVLTDKTAMKATEKADTWTTSLFMKDESALPDGEYGIDFYIGEDLLTSGKVTIGGGGDTPSSVTVQGTVTDSKSKKPIKGAMVVVLNEGVDAQTWLDEGGDSDIFASAKTDSKGQFTLDNPIDIGVKHAWLIGAQGYKPIVKQDMVIEEGAEDPVEFDIALVKK